jgi:ribosomal protein L9
MREKQKDNILENLNAIEDTFEKQLLSDMKKFGLISYTDIYKKSNEDEVNIKEDIYDENIKVSNNIVSESGEVENAEDSYEIEGEHDFAQRPTDSDELNEDLLE